MAENKMIIEVLVRDEVSAQLKSIQGKTGKFGKKVGMNFTELAAKVYLFQKAIMSASRVLSVFVNNASKVQNLGVRLKVLLGTVEEGNRLFDDMRSLASSIPFEFDQIMESATNLAAVVRGGADEVNELMPIIADLAAATGISVADTTSQMIRMYSSGAASADMFRERGVLAMLGFQAGVAVSAEDTMKQVKASWEDVNSNFRGATDELAETWTGTISILKDSWFNFTAALGESITENEEILAVIERITETLNQLTEAIKQFDAIQEAGADLNIFDILFGGAEKKINEFNKKIEAGIVNLDKIIIDKETGLNKKKDALRKKQNEDIISTARETLEILAGINKDAAMVLKIVKTGEAIINTHAAVNQALASGPPPGSWVLAAINLAKGLAEVAAIQAVPFAEGGIVTRPTLGLVGEAGPEAIIPLSGGGGIGGFGDINITIENATIGSEEGISALAEELGFEIERQKRYGSGI